MKPTIQSLSNEIKGLKSKLTQAENKMHEAQQLLKEETKQKEYHQNFHLDCLRHIKAADEEKENNAKSIIVEKLLFVEKMENGFLTREYKRKAYSGAGAVNVADIPAKHVDSEAIIIGHVIKDTLDLLTHSAAGKRLLINITAKAV